MQNEKLIKKINMPASIPIRANGINVEVENNQVTIPRDKVLVKNLIKYLDEDFFITPLTGRKCVTNSKREVGGN